MSEPVERLRKAATAMREEHGPEHRRHAMWVAIANWLEREANNAVAVTTYSYTAEMGAAYPSSNSRPMKASDFRREVSECNPYPLAVADAYLESRIPNPEPEQGGSDDEETGAA